MAINKKTRQIVYEKYDGRCAYCGNLLVKGWHVDHIQPKTAGGCDGFENLNPSCYACNNYKCHSSLETFRMYTKQMLNEKLHYLFKSKTKMQVAINFGAVILKEWDGLFYFEKKDIIFKC
jgi:5-methylcytosine-specific restriction endonuclease McrA